MQCGDNDTARGMGSNQNVNQMGGQEVKLFQALNGFIALISNHGNDNPAFTSSDGSNNTSKNIANFLRLNLLSYLRHCQQYTDRVQVHREVLTQWWITLLNFLNSELIVNSQSGENESLQEKIFSDPIWNTDTVSVSLECVSRLMSTLMVLPVHHYRETEIYSHHILLTIHCVTNQIIFNSKHIRLLGRDQSVKARRYLHFLKSYSTLLRSFLGKLNAYAFFYLPDDFHYDTQLLLVTCPRLTYKQSPIPSLFPWKRKVFETTSDESQRINTDELETHDTRFFKIVVSYMQNESIFIAFYWHYWYIVLRFLSFADGHDNLSNNLGIIPGSEVLLNHVTVIALEEDLKKLNNFLKVSHTKGHPSNSSLNVTADTMPDSTTSTVTNDGVLTPETLNDYVFSYFRTIKLWESLRSLSGCFNNSLQIISLLALHDKYQLRYISSISAYDGHLANVVYNKILQFIIFQFDSVKSVDFLDWEAWTSGLLSMLQTLRANCQIVSLICLFNVWESLPLGVQERLSLKLIKDYWSTLTLDSDFHLVKVIFFKLLIFRIFSKIDYNVKEELRMTFQSLYEEMVCIYEKTDKSPFNAKSDPLSFYGNKKFFLMPNKCPPEDNLIRKAEKHMKMKTNTKYQNFTTVIGIANIRPSFVLKGGRYPYDVLDEMVVKATLLLRENKRKNAESPLPPVPRSKSDSSEIRTDVTTKFSGPASFSSTVGSWFNRFSPKAGQEVKGEVKSDEFVKAATETHERKLRRSSRGTVSSETSLPNSESVELLSMYSNVSSLATGNSSTEDQLNNSRNTERGMSGAVHSSKFSKDGTLYEIKDDSRRVKPKKKLLSPIELKYSSSVADDQAVSIVFKPVIIPCDPLAKTIEKANVSWSITTAKTYEKPLPTPNSTDYDSLIEDLHYDSIHVSSVDSFTFEVEDSDPGLTLQSSGTHEPTLPVPNFELFSNSQLDPLAGDAEMLRKFGSLSIEKKESKRKGDACESDSRRHVRSLEPLAKNDTMRLETRLNKIASTVRIFNKTIEERFEYLNFSNQKALFMDFEIRVPTYSAVSNTNG